MPSASGNADRRPTHVGGKIAADAFTAQHTAPGILRPFPVADSVGCESLMKRLASSLLSAPIVAILMSGLPSEIRILLERQS